MDLLAALALVLVLEGMALAIFARSAPELMAAMSEIDPVKTRTIGLICILFGALGYLFIRGSLAG